MKENNKIKYRIIERKKDSQLRIQGLCNNNNDCGIDSTCIDGVCMFDSTTLGGTIDEVRGSFYTVIMLGIMILFTLTLAFKQINNIFFDSQSKNKRSKNKRSKNNSIKLFGSSTFYNASKLYFMKKIGDILNKQMNIHVQDQIVKTLITSIVTLNLFNPVYDSIFGISKNKIVSLINKSLGINLSRQVSPGNIINNFLDLNENDINNRKQIITLISSIFLLFISPISKINNELVNYDETNAASVGIIKDSELGNYLNFMSIFSKGLDSKFQYNLLLIGVLSLFVLLPKNIADEINSFFDSNRKRKRKRKRKKSKTLTKLNKVKRNMNKKLNKVEKKIDSFFKKLLKKTKLLK